LPKKIELELLFTVIYIKQTINQTKMFKTPMPHQRLSVENVKRLHALAKVLETDKDPIEVISTGLRERAINIQIDFNNIEIKKVDNFITK